MTRIACMRRKPPIKTTRTSLADGRVVVREFNASRSYYHAHIEVPAKGANHGVRCEVPAKGANHGVR